MIPCTHVGTLPGGTDVYAYTLTNRYGIELEVLTLGGIVRRLSAPDRMGQRDDIVLGMDTLMGYHVNEPHFGALVGRFANRIAHGRFMLDGTTYDLVRNDGPHHLHGGLRSFSRVVWRAEPFEAAGRRGLVLAYTSPDREEGYPGTLDVRVTYTLADEGTWTIDYQATADRPTPVNLTQHTYFNLLGSGFDLLGSGFDLLGRGVIDGHELQLHASRYLPTDAAGIPSGELAAVDGTRFDFRTPRPIGEASYDHCFVVDGEAGVLRPAARLYAPTTGRVLTVQTTAPGLQVFTADTLDPAAHGHAPRTGLALEAQGFPDAPNQPAFPSSILRPGQVYRQRTVYGFEAI